MLRVGDQSLAGRIPEGLRDAVGKRLSRLSDSTNRVLSVASVIGHEFQLHVLRQVVTNTDEELEAALEEASAASMIEEQSVVGTNITYRFCHAFFRQTLYDEIVAPRRIRLHQQVARALQEVFGRVECVRQVMRSPNRDRTQWGAPRVWRNGRPLLLIQVVPHRLLDGRSRRHAAPQLARARLSWMARPMRSAPPATTRQPWRRCVAGVRRLFSR